VIEYTTNREITVQQFRSLLVASTLGERRPIDDLGCLEGMLDNANLIATAWDGERLVGVARSVTDFYYCCYLSDLAVDFDYQKQGIGRRLIAEIQRRLEKNCKLILVAAPAANDYYRHIGFTNNERCWILSGEQAIK
jgi:GNAT superfamily N-acetyltransferase